MNLENKINYSYSNSELGCAHKHLIPSLLEIFTHHKLDGGRIFDLGCGNGSIANWLNNKGFIVSGCDPSEQGIAQANKAFPNLDLRVGSAYDNLSDKFGKFPLVISLEVIEHVYAPRQYASCINQLLEPGGLAIISTPYHGYLKNLALALTNSMDKHFTALWDHGHIKFWSINTITTLLAEADLTVEKVWKAGRIPPFAKSMIVIAQKQP